MDCHEKVIINTLLVLAKKHVEREYATVPSHKREDHKRDEVFIRLAQEYLGLPQVGVYIPAEKCDECEEERDPRDIRECSLCKTLVCTGCDEVKNHDCSPGA